MTTLPLLTRLVLDFHSESGEGNRPSEDLSAVCLAPDGALWLASDEGASLERLERVDAGTFGRHSCFDLREYLPSVGGPDAEIDIEGLDVAGGYIWVVGSHGAKRKKPKGKDRDTDVRRLATVVADPERGFLARVPLDGDRPRVECIDAKGRKLRAARLPATPKGNALIEALWDDEHLGAFVRAGIPGKDNGFDVEGLCVEGDLLHLGLRGPVLRGFACVLTVKPVETDLGTLGLAPLDDKGTLVRKAFLDLDGLGVRDMRLHSGGLLLLAGPTMSLDGAIRLFRLDDVGDLGRGIVHGGEGRDGARIRRLLEIPHGVGIDRAEGLTVFPWGGLEDSLLVVFDAPGPHRRLAEGTVLADVWRPEWEGRR